MVSVTVKMAGLQELRTELAGFSERRLKAATATALTRTAKQVSKLWQNEINTRLDKPMLFTQRAVRFEGAKADKLSAKVALKDVSSSGGMSQSEYLQQHEYGGGRLVKKFERALIASGAMPGGYITVPGRGVERNAYGNVSRSTIIAVIAHLGANYSAGYRRVISSDPRKRAKSQARRGRSYFVMPVGNGSVSPGVYVRLPLGDMQMVFAFKKMVSYSRKLTLQSSADQEVPVIFREEFDRAIRESMARLRARG